MAKKKSNAGKKVAPKSAPPKVSKMSQVLSAEQKEGKKPFNTQAFWMKKDGSRNEKSTKMTWSFFFPKFAGSKTSSILLNIASKYNMEFNVEVPKTDKDKVAAQNAIDIQKELGIWKTLTPDQQKPLLDRVKQVKIEGKLSAQDQSILILSLISKLELLSAKEKAFFKNQIQFFQSNCMIDIKRPKKKKE